VVEKVAQAQALAAQALAAQALAAQALAASTHIFLETGTKGQ
jgi:hypothetical protein